MHDEELEDGFSHSRPPGENKFLESGSVDRKFCTLYINSLDGVAQQSNSLLQWDPEHPDQV